MQGGIEYIRNMTIGASDTLAITIISDREFGWFGKKTKKGLIGIKTYETIYEFSIMFKKKGLGFEIVHDKLIQKCKFVLLERQNKNIKEKEKFGDGEIVISCSRGKIEIQLNTPAKVPIEKDDIIPAFLRSEKLSQKTLLLQTYFMFLPPLEEVFTNMLICDFDPKLPKKATPITGKVDLEEDGNNLSIVLKNIIKDKNKKRKLFNLINNVLPFISDLDVEKFADKSLLFKLQEKYFKKEYLPASLVSDGTINITALIIALYFEKKPLTIIEEPERNIHPYLISKIVDMKTFFSK